MIENLPSYISVIFALTTLATLAIFYKASEKKSYVLWMSILWLTAQAIVAYSGFYTIENTLPPRFALAILPPFLLILYLFTSGNGKKFIDNFDIKSLTYLHTVRIPVEIVLFWLFIHNQIPELMTFEGRNFDILAGITAPLVAYFGFTKGYINKKVILLWNFAMIGLLANIVINAILSAQTPFQQFAFDQPNVGVMYFPFIWLPCYIVPVVFFSHVVSIRLLLKEKTSSNIKQETILVKNLMKK